MQASGARLPDVATKLFTEENRKDIEPEQLARVRVVIGRLYDRHVLGDGAISLGATWGCHVQIAKKGEMRLRPMVESIENGSAAKAAGLKVGDVICYVNKKELARQGGLPVFRKILAESEGKKITLTVRGSKLQGRSNTSKLDPPRDIVVKVTGKSKKKPDKREGQREAWVRDLRALYGP